MELRRLAEQTIPARFSGLTAVAALVLVGAGIAVGLSTFLVLTGMTPIRPSDKIISWFLTTNVTVVVLMALLVAIQLFHLLRERTRGTAGAGLHLRLVGLFSIVAVAPALLVAAFAAVTLNRGLDAWFSERTRNIVDTATTVAEAYLTNAGEATRNDLAGISQDLSQQTELYKNDRQAFVRRVARHAALRNLAGVFVFDPATKRIDVSVTANERIRFIAPEDYNLEKAKNGDAVVIQPGRGGNVVRALVKLQGYDNLYLYVYRLISLS